MKLYFFPILEYSNSKLKLGLFLSINNSSNYSSSSALRSPKQDTSATNDGRHSAIMRYIVYCHQRWWAFDNVRHVIACENNTSKSTELFCEFTQVKSTPHSCKLFEVLTNCHQKN